MSADKPRRSKAPQAPEPVTGYRQTRRGSKAARSAVKAEKMHRAAVAVSRTGSTAKSVGIVIAQGIALVGVVALVLLLSANAVNMIARWNARRSGDGTAGQGGTADKARENIVVIGVEGEKATGYLALRVDDKKKQVFGIAIPEGAFIDVPGQGFQRVGEAYDAGPDVTLSAVSNFLTVPFSTYMVVPAAAYRDALTRQSVSGLASAVTSSNLSAQDLRALDAILAGISQKDVAMVPMPTKPIKLGDQTYFEPQRAQVADLIKSWWGVDPAKAQQTTRVIVYNGAGSPGIAGEAAQVLIRAGFRVVDTKNADNFKYKKTLVVVHRGKASRAIPIVKALGVGVISVDPSDANVTDVIVIIGKDYRPRKDAK